MFSQRRLFSYGFAGCVALTAIALYFQYVMGLEPCPLCILQRVFVIGLGLVMLAGACHDPKGVGRRIYGGVITLIGVFGVGVAGRHVWLQNLPPDQVPECGPGLDYLLSVFPLREALEIIFKGSGECAQVQWTFLRLTIPGWTLVIFVALTGFGGYLLVTRRRPPAVERRDR